MDSQQKPKRRITRRGDSSASSERTAVNAAFGILGTIGGLVIYSAVNEKFKVPAELWGLATAATVYLFGTARKGREENEPEEGNDNDA